MAVNVVRRVPVDTDHEQQLITGLVVSTEFCRKVLPLVKLEHVKDPQSRRVVSWVQDYFKRYDKAPGLEVQTLFKLERPHLSETEGGLLERYLATLSTKYAESERHNWDFQADLSRDYLRARDLEDLEEKVRVLRERGDLVKAETLVRDFTRTGSFNVDFVKPFLDKALQQQVMERKDTGLFRMPGAVGEIFGWWQRGWLVSFFGPMKRGKTWWLVEVAVEAMSQGLKVLFISLEMGKEDLSKRFYQRALSLPDKSGPLRIPCWDCASNQDGTCQLTYRKNREPIPMDLEGTPRYDENSKYQPCSHCKTDPNNLQHYRIASWFKIIHKRESLFQNMIRRLRAFSLGYHGGNLELKCYPRFGGSVEDIESDLETLVGNGFLADVVVVDYAGILEAKGDRLDQLDYIWKNLAKIASKRKLLMVTASQGTRDAIKSKSMDMTQTAEDIRIMAHIDLGISLNQITETKRGKVNEREQMILRLGAMAVRHGHTPNDEVFVLQNLDLGQPAMDAWAVSAGHRLLGSREEVPAAATKQSWR